MMDRPDMAELGRRSMWHEETWRDAWVIVTGYFEPGQVVDVWTAIRNASMGASDWIISPRNMAAALVNAHKAVT